MIRNMLITSNWAPGDVVAMDGSSKYPHCDKKKVAKNASEPRDGRANRDELLSVFFGTIPFFLAFF